MNIKNKYCLLSELTQAEIDMLKGLMPDSQFWRYQHRVQTLVGFAPNGNAGLWCRDPIDQIITYKEMLSLLGAKDEELVPHVHQKEIIAWANGAEIEVQAPHGMGWYPYVGVAPRWQASAYRVKPKLTPTQLRIKELTEELMELKEQDDVECGIDKLMGS